MENKLAKVDLSSLDQLVLRCAQHKQVIFGINKQSSNEGYLKCPRCIKEQKLNLDSIIDLTDFQKQVQELQAILTGKDSIKIDDDLTIIDYSDNLNQIQQKIDSEKQVLRQNFDGLAIEFKKQCDEKYEQVAKLLDNQLIILRNNIQNYNNHINDCKSTEGSPFSKFLKDIVNEQDAEKYEQLISQFISYQKFTDICKENEGGQIQSALRQLKDDVNKQFQEVSQKSNPLDKVIQVNKDIQEKIGNLYKEFNLTSLNPQHLSLASPFFNKSKILSHSEGEILLKLMKNQTQRNFKMELIYQGSVDGFTADTFFLKCCRSYSTIIVVESTDGYKFGGYSDMTWAKVEMKHYRSYNTWLYSIDKNKVYPVKNPDKAIYYCRGYGAVFGQSGDLALASEGDATAQCQSKLGQNYEDKGDKFLAKDRYFKIKEIETYHVEFEK